MLTSPSNKTSSNLHEAQELSGPLPEKLKSVKILKTFTHVNKQYLHVPVINYTSRYTITPDNTGSLYLYQLQEYDHHLYNNTSIVNSLGVLVFICFCVFFCLKLNYSFNLYLIYLSNMLLSSTCMYV